MMYFLQTCIIPKNKKKNFKKLKKYSKLIEKTYRNRNVIFA